MEENEAKIKLRSKIPAISELEVRFSFIDDETLRKNLAIAFQYIIFLIALLDELDAEKTTISSTMHKDMIVQTGTIVESCLHYCLKKHIESGKVKSTDVMPTDWEIRNPILLHEISDSEQVCGVTRSRKTEHLSDQTNFIVLNRAAKKSGILSQKLFDDAESIRQLRNKIHISGLQSVDDTYDKSTSQEVFESARRVIEMIEKKISEI